MTLDWLEKKAGELTENFNVYFEGIGVFGKPSELVFDVNVYAFTLEYAMPFNFVGLPQEFANNIAQKERTIASKMQELASAYVKVFKYNETFFTDMKNGALNAITSPEYKVELVNQLSFFEKLNGKLSLKQGDSLITIGDLRRAHNNKYQTTVKSMSDAGGYKSDLLNGQGN